jgi:hypothetical protein
MIDEWEGGMIGRIYIWRWGYTWAIDERATVYWVFYDANCMMFSGVTQWSYVSRPEQW